MSTTITLYSTLWCTKCRRVEAFLTAVGLPFSHADPDADAEARKILESLKGKDAVLPMLVVDNIALPDCEDDTLAQALGVEIPDEINIFDVAIIGSGPAGITAAIYCSRENFTTLVLERGLPGGQAALTAEIENYPGFPEPVSGMELMERAYRQAERFGANIHTGEEATSFAKKDALFQVTTTETTHRARTLILAPGAEYRRLGVPGEEELIGRGVSFCATCDAPFYRARPVVVVGGGNSALQETLHLTGYVSSIKLIQIMDHLTASPILEERVRAMHNVEILLSHQIEEVLGEDGGVTGVRVTDLATKKTETIACEGVFIFIGQQPNTANLKGFVELDEAGFIDTDPATLETSIAGVYAAGDARAQSSKQITAAVGEGTVASFMVSAQLARLKEH
jgi:thioredoxin reductase (NADPH)